VSAPGIPLLRLVTNRQAVRRPIVSFGCCDRRYWYLALAWGDRESDPVWEVELVLPIGSRLRENGTHDQP
jgi:hypothetical protein